MSSTTEDNDEAAENGTIDKSKRVVIYPKGYGSLTAFLNDVQDEYSPHEMKERSHTTTTYMMEVDGDRCDLTEEQYEVWKDNDAEDVDVWVDEETSTTTERRYSNQFIARKWLRRELGESMVGGAEKKENSAYWRYDGSAVLALYCTVKTAPMVKKLPEQSHDDIYVDDDTEYQAIVMRFNCQGLPKRWEEDLNETIGKFSAQLQRRDDIEAVRPVGCFQVEKTEEVCPRV